MSEYNKIQFIKNTYQPWDYQLDAAKVSHQKRFTGKEILFDIYRCKILNSQFYDYSYAYKLKSNYVSIKILRESTQKAAYYASSTILNVDMDISFPLEVINEDIARIKARASHSDKNGQIFCTEEAWDGAPHGICYTRLLSILKNFPEVSFQQQPAQRALGFWLWEQIDFLQNFKTVTAAIQYLRSGEALPPDILRRIGLDYPEYRQYNRLCQCTRRCVEQGEVLAIK